MEEILTEVIRTNIDWAIEIYADAADAASAPSAAASDYMADATARSIFLTYWLVNEDKLKDSIYILSRLAVVFCVDPGSDAYKSVCGYLKYCLRRDQDGDNSV